MASLTIKKIDEALLVRLRDQARQRNQSLNSFVRELLARSVGMAPGVEAYTDLSSLAGSWTQEDEEEFLENTRPLREIDEDLWR